ncbi:hypothetical protein ZHAS_00000730 [Anopheles sinensis]|uniref:Uncharacterized protein n=1 Tax=Anopheles sinensis TaxID=74873 RepID=A0A084VAG2_ANOSI|nr:hypothetical protein ZHAS_00000730 [Anopheles sinensis]
MTKALESCWMCVSFPLVSRSGETVRFQTLDNYLARTGTVKSDPAGRAAE